MTESDGKNPAGQGNIFSRTWRRLALSSAELESEELQREAKEVGAVPIESCADREKVVLSGTIATVSIQPRSGSPSLEVELRDGSGIVTLVWMGRRQIPGIEAGRSVRITGRISCHEGRRVLYNPRYELLPTPQA